MAYQKNAIALKLIKWLAYALAVFIIVELSLRVLGYGPLPSSRISNNPTIPNIHTSDDLLGWKLSPNFNQRILFANSGDSIHITTNAQGNRITRNSSVESRSDKMLLLGGSFTFGWGLSDHQGLGWKLQEEFPKFSVENLAVGAYGGYQSLLVLESELEKAQKPAVVVYGFIYPHLLRNVAAARWMEIISTPQNNVRLPYASLNKEGHLIRHPLEGALKIPLTSRLASAVLVRKVIMRFRSFKREQDALMISNKVIQRMKELCEENGIKFYVAILMYNESKIEEQLRWFEDNKINYVDCNVPLNESTLIKGDNHPNESVHQVYSNRISDRLHRDGIY